MLETVNVSSDWLGTIGGARSQLLLVYPTQLLIFWFSQPFSPIVVQLCNCATREAFI